MAKRFDNDFDAEGFVENFRAKEDTSASCPDNDERIRMRDVPVRKHDVAGSVQGEPALADEYQARFIDDLKYRLPPAGWPQVKISPEFKTRIVNMENMCRSFRSNLSTFINNVLEQHFRDYEKHINELNRKYEK